MSRWEVGRMWGDRHLPLMGWAYGLRDGDLIETCSSFPFTTRVKGDLRDLDWWSVREYRCPRGVSLSRHARCVKGVGVWDTEGKLHWAFTGGACLVPPAPDPVTRVRDVILGKGDDGTYPTEEQVRSYHQEFARRWRPSEVRDSYVQYQMDLWQRVKDGRTVCDPYGIRTVRPSW